MYLFKDKHDQVLYVGKAIDLRSRVKSYFQGQDSRPKVTLLLPQIASINHIEVNSEFEALLLEAALIKKHLPKFNTVAKDDKHPLYIAVTKEDFPKIRVIRRTEDIGPAEIFGPFPSAYTVRQVLKFLRRIFPYCSCKNNRGRPCLYASIGLCRPCPRRVLTLEQPQQDQFKRAYRRQMRWLIRLLNGQAPQVLHSLQKEMNKASRAQDFELAADYRDGHAHLQQLLQPQQSPFKYIENPRLRLEIRQQAVRELALVLNQNHIFPPLKHVERIEAYDISTLSGKFSTGSLVVFSGGEPDKSQYRRFKIKQEGQPNDVAMMTEMLHRRFKRQPNDKPKQQNADSWPLPDLIVVDGGKPQVSAARRVLDHYQLAIPLIGLAKRLEEIVIYTANQPHPYTSLRLSASSLALQVIQHLRDEAHRFANRYRKKLLKI